MCTLVRVISILNLSVYISSRIKTSKRLTCVRMKFCDSSCHIDDMKNDILSTTEYDKENEIVSITESDLDDFRP